MDQADRMWNLPNDIDQIAVVVDWLDACRARDLDALVELYAAQGASLECECDGPAVHEGRAKLASYWRPRLDSLAPTAFGMNEIMPVSHGVVLDYLSFEGKPVRMFFTFDGEGKILQTRCVPSAELPRR